MLLDNKITLTLACHDSQLYDNSNPENIAHLKKFYYTLNVHNYNKELALISLVRSSFINCDESDLTIIEYEELKIPHDLTAKDWIRKLALEKDVVFKAEKEEFGDLKEYAGIVKIKKDFESGMLQLNIKSF